MLMRATGRGSISSVLKLAVDVVWVLACALLGFIWIIAGFSLYNLVTGDQLLPVFERVVVSTPRDLVVWSLNGSILCVCIMIVCAYLRGVFETLVARDPFVPENAKRFTAIGIVLAIMEAASMLVTAAASLLLTVFGLAGDNPAFTLGRINWAVWVAVLTLLVLAQVFREGAAMREEQKMTI